MRDFCSSVGILKKQMDMNSDFGKKTIKVTTKIFANEAEILRPVRESQMRTENPHEWQNESIVYLKYA